VVGGHWWVVYGNRDVANANIFLSVGVYKIILRENYKYTPKTFLNSKNTPNFLEIPKIHPNALDEPEFSLKLSPIRNIKNIYSKRSKIHPSLNPSFTMTKSAPDNLFCYAQFLHIYYNDTTS
jgi:hypothetical protein